MLHLKSAKLSIWQIRAIFWSGGILWLSGAVWLVLHYFFQLIGDFGPEANPAEPWLLRVHGAALIVATATAGGLLLVHIWRGWAYKNQRFVGAALGGSMLLLILTGYLLYYVGDEVIRPWVSVIHWVIGLAAAPLFILHYQRRTRARAFAAAGKPAADRPAAGKPTVARQASQRTLEAVDVDGV